jgi:hypothetical protein
MRGGVCEGRECMRGGVCAGRECMRGGVCTWHVEEVVWKTFVDITLQEEGEGQQGG